MMKSSNSWVDQTSGPIKLFLAAGLTPSVSILANAALFVSLGAVLHLQFRRLETLTHYAIAGVIARLFTYHRVYDDLLLIFLLLALGLTALERRSRITALAFVIVGLSVWPPARLTDLRPFQIFQMLAWCGGLACLLAVRSRSKPDVSSAEQDVPVLAPG